jgi:hypothetical protein
LDTEQAETAAITDAESVQSTDWPQILTLYDQLLALAPTPVVALNRAIAVGEVHGPQAALDLVDRLNLPDYHAFHATRPTCCAASAASSTLPPRRQTSRARWSSASPSAARSRSPSRPGATRGSPAWSPG